MKSVIFRFHELHLGSQLLGGKSCMCVVSNTLTSHISLRPKHRRTKFKASLYGAPFVTCTLLLTEANFVQQKSLLSDKSNFVYDKIIFVRQKLILSDKS